MDMEMMPFVWVGIMVFLLIVEALTAGLTTIWFAGGALAAAVAAWLGAGLVFQVLLFLGVSLVLLFFTRPVAMKLMNRHVQKTNVNSLPGMRALVTSDIDNLSQKGQVRINDVEWTARSRRDDKPIPAGTVVTILEVRGVKLIVEECGEEEER